jgi:hypothetical protein
MTLVGGAVASPLVARAQIQVKQVRRVAVLAGAPENDPEIVNTMIRPFQQELKKLGWELGRNLYIDYGWEVIGRGHELLPRNY